MKNRPQKILVFNWYFPHYRQGLFANLSNHTSRYYIFLGPFNYPGHYLNTECLYGIRCLDIKSWRIPIPFTNNYMTVQPYAFISMLKGDFDVMIMANDILGLDVWLNVIFSRLFGKKVVLWGHGISRPVTRFRDGLRKILMNFAHAVIFYSDGARDYWINKGIPEEKIFIAYNALNTQEIDAQKKQINADVLTDFLKLNNIKGRNLVLYCGRLLESKRPDIVLKAMKIVVDKIPDAHAIIIGDGPMKHELLQMAHDLKIEHAINFAGPIFNESTLAKYYLSAKVSIMPSGAGLAIQHAFGYGVPIIISDDKNHGPEAELVIHEQTGLICRSGNIGEFAFAMAQLLTDDNLQKDFSINALRLIETRYNMQKMAEGIDAAVTYCLR